MITAGSCSTSPCAEDSSHKRPQRPRSIRTASPRSRARPGSSRSRPPTSSRRPSTRCSELKAVRATTSVATRPRSDREAPPLDSSHVVWLSPVVGVPPRPPRADAAGELRGRAHRRLTIEHLPEKALRPVLHRVSALCARRTRGTVAVFHDRPVGYRL